MILLVGIKELMRFEENRKSVNLMISSSRIGYD